MKNTLHSERNHGLDTLRALAIVLVVLHHYVLFVAARDTFGWVGRIGWIGVDLFFALSGYLIGNQIFSALRSSEGLSLRRFYARRFLRTLPNYYVVLALYALWPWFRAGLEMPPLWRFLTFTLNINQEPGTAFSHAWSLCIEEQFYVLLPAVALCIAGLRKSLRWAWAAIGMVVLAGVAVRYQMWTLHVGPDGSDGSDYFRYIYYSTLCRFDELVAGVALALLKNYHAAAWQRLTAMGNLALAAGSALLALTFWLFLDDRTGLLVTLTGFPMLALGFSLLIVAALSEDGWLRRARVPGAASLALWSYAIYLVHKQLCILARAPLRELGYPPESLPAVAAMLALSVFGGWLLYRCVEMPFMALRQRHVPSNLKPA
ncbi:acyltransferase [Massilia sp. CF038]|uniref:acyltransferase family protein n=1 Tax=Massilia sp. CF038 TaxID=1881045 RepID=UPI00091D8DA4|nr:acyltransferase [Massilia sp. CF038]SHG99448.1 Peptidoglycan/LPS O-acetylase OafA/YrhL, contains acyltransferase and SGNH-hydrolase domains [Massilia sp. CF038]